MSAPGTRAAAAAAVEILARVLPALPATAQQAALAQAVRAELADFCREAAARSGFDCGALVSFEGLVRRLEEGAPLWGLHYEAHAAMAEPELRRVAAACAARHGCRAVAVAHLAGPVAVGAPSIFVVCAGGHRAETFACACDLMDELKRTVPIWKSPLWQAPAARAAAPPTPEPTEGNPPRP